MRKLLLFLLLTIPASVLGQTTTVTGTIVDPAGNPYASGTASAQKVVATGINPGTPFNTTTNGAGLFTFSGAQALPSPASYIFTICATPTQLGPKANPTPVQVCFANSNPIAISGASQDVSATLNAIAVTLGPNISANVAGANITYTGSNVHNGPEVFQGLGNIKWANSSTAGSDWCAKVNTQDTALGSTAGEVWVDHSAGTSCTTAISLGSTGPHLLHLVQGGVYTVSQTVTVGENSGIVCDSPGLQFSTLGTPAKFCTIKAANSSNLPAVVLLNGASSFLRDINIDGNKANNPTGGVDIKGQDARFARLDNVSAMNAPTHGAWFNSSGLGAGGGSGCCVSIGLGSMFSLNGMDGVFFSLSSDNFDAAQHENNGSTFTVNTTATSMTATSGAWSTDLSLVNTYVSIVTSPPTLCQVTATGSTTTATLANCVPALGTNTGVTASWGNGVEQHDTPTTRLVQCDLGGNAHDGFLAHGTTAGLGIYENQILGCNFGNQKHHDIEIISADPSNGTVVGWGQIVMGNIFVDGGSKTPNGVWDNIKCQDCYQDEFVNFYSSGPATHQAKCAVEFQETAANRSFPSEVGGNFLTAPNSYTSNPPFGPSTCDGTAQGNWVKIGNRIYTSSIGGGRTALELFDAATATSTFIRGNNGGVDFLNNAFAKEFALTSAGNPQLFGATSGSTLLAASAVASGTLTFPAATDTLVARTTIDTLTNKTLTSPVLTTPTLTGITNGTGLQLFNTTTTCTTAATINTPCTTAAITLPVGYSDTNYRLSISCLGVTAFPQVQTYTKSNTTFTITLNNLTAAAATCSSFDVIVGHN